MSGLTILSIMITFFLFGKWHGEWCFKKYLLRKVNSDETFNLDGEDYFIIRENDFLQLMSEGYIYNRSTIKAIKQYEF